MDWRCFHCGTVCKTEEHAREHFGTSTDARLPACFMRGEAWAVAREQVRLAIRDMDNGMSDVARQRILKAHHALSGVSVDGSVVFGEA